ncbi:hypothetical protein ACWCXB_35880 [Streptomyces sp. NPDC001514]
MRDNGVGARRPVTMVFTRDVTAGKEAEFEQWAHGLQRAAAGFPGNLTYLVTP